MTKDEAKRVRNMIQAVKKDNADLRLLFKIMDHDNHSLRRERDSLVSAVRRMGHNVRFDKQGCAVIDGKWNGRQWVK